MAHTKREAKVSSDTVPTPADTAYMHYSCAPARDHGISREDMDVLPTGSSNGFAEDEAMIAAVQNRMRDIRAAIVSWRPGLEPMAPVSKSAARCKAGWTGKSGTAAEPPRALRKLKTVVQNG